MPKKPDTRPSSGQPPIHPPSQTTTEPATAKGAPAVDPKLRERAHTHGVVLDADLLPAVLAWCLTFGVPVVYPLSVKGTERPKAVVFLEGMRGQLLKLVAVLEDLQA